MPPLIIGGGPAGSAAAIALAQHGIRATLIERDRDIHDAICGGFMSWRTLGALKGLGVEPQGHTVTTLAIFAGNRVVRAPLPHAAIGLSRRALDGQMRATAAGAGANVECGVGVREIAGNHVHCADGATLESDAVFLAVGKHDLRGLARPRENVDPTLGLRIRIPSAPRLMALIANTIELHLFDRGYVGLVLQEDGSANLCLAVRKSRLAEAGGRPEALLRDIGNGTPLGDRLSFADVMTPDAIAAIPYGWRIGKTAPGLFRLGDQAAVIPSLAGEGIGIAVASGIAAANAYARGGAKAASDYQRSFAHRTRRPVTVASALWHSAERPQVARLAMPLISAFPGLTALAARLTRIGD
ncbi:MAG: FAD-dependent monooxygenase [Sphingomonadales bacterium]